MSSAPTQTASGSKRAASVSEDGGAHKKQKEKATEETREERRANSEIRRTQMDAVMEQCQARLLDILRTSLNADDGQEGLAPSTKTLISEVTQEMAYKAMEITLEEDRVKLYDEVDDYINTMLVVTRAASERLKAARNAEMRD
ncbi:hypothetical protein JAAARDRAFT_201284 [Jaapia argillacea MUCL 33604]|uniref:Uncharacterized protein n=1 Tax=Jaapia argillacea MUCL 33604 TaxID=933084 RepID=A0A067PER4_9AGAM|nr:hypothetical protein JAAARDRAFT_201284 [Jaapia argillacea MUCL 33604]